MASSEILGWAGAACALAAFVLVQNGKITLKGSVYNWMNLFAGLTLGYSAYARGAMAVAVFNGIWTAIALWGLGRILWAYQNRLDAEFEGYC